MATALSDSEVQVRDALIRVLNRAEHFDGHPSLRDWARAHLPGGGDASRDAWRIVARRLRAPDLTDPKLLAGAWLRGLRSTEEKSIERDAAKRLKEIFPGGARTNDFRSVGRRRLVAAACLQRDDEWRTGKVRNQATVFQTSDKSPTPGEKLVGLHLMRAAEEWFVQDGEAGWLRSDPSLDDVAVSQELAHALRMRGQQIGALPSYYPEHLMVDALATGREVATYETPVGFRQSEGFYSAALLESSEVLPASEALAAERRAVLLGDPGSGKSTVVGALIRAEIAAGRTLAAFAPATAVVNFLDRESLSPLEAVATAALGLVETADDPNHVAELVGRLEWDAETMLVIDGIDEVFEKRQRVALDRAISTLGELPGRVLLTSRVMGYSQRKGWSEYVLCPIVEGFEGLVEGWYRDADPDASVRALEIYRRSPTVRAMVQAPVLAGIICALASDPTSRLDVSLVALYEQAVSLFCEREWKHPEVYARSEAETTALVREYQRAAWFMAVGAGEPKVERWRSHTSYRQLDEGGLDSALLRSGELLVAYGVPAVTASVDRPWVWLHRSFADYLVGRELLTLWRRDQESAGALIRDAVLYLFAWSGALHFLVASMDHHERVDLSDLIWELRLEGDPGLVVLEVAEYLFAPYGDLYKRFALQLLALDEPYFPRLDEDTTNRWRSEVCPSMDDLLAEPERIVYWLGDFDGSEEQIGRLARAYFGSEPSLLVNDTGIDARERRTMSLLSEHAPDSLAEAVLRRCFAPTAEAFRGGIPGLPIPQAVSAVWSAKAWKEFESRAFPDNLPFARVLDSVLFESPADSISDDAMLARWVIGTEHTLDSTERCRSLVDAALRGDYGVSAAFAVGYARDLRIPPGVGASVAALAGRALSRCEEKGSTASRRDSPLSAEKLAVVQAFGADHLSDFARIHKLGEALQAIGPSSGNEALKAVIILGQRLLIGDRPLGPSILYSHRYLQCDVTLAVQAAVSVTLSRAAGSHDDSAMLRAAIELLRDGQLVSPRALPALPLWPNHSGNAPNIELEMISWMLEVNPGSLNFYEEFFEQENDAQYLERALEVLESNLGRLPFSFAFDFFRALEKMQLLPRLWGQIVRAWNRTHFPPYQRLFRTAE